MNDAQIIELFFSRNEKALSECKRQYGSYCRALARRILGPGGDAEEAENRAYLAAWESIPPQKPESVMAYLGKLTRRKAIDLLRADTRKKRGGSEYSGTVEELDECLYASPSAESEAERALLRDALNAFLRSLPEKSRLIFMRRYWWLSPVSEIARDLSMSESAVKMQLLRTRQKLKEHLEKEGFSI
ncbi:MAG: sigma-70 family RNA polymerase sigma factor [Clostridia bacterium]|nr:sigma-70 family RNA polymerase sigma factor [Clostridia bacterium]